MGRFVGRYEVRRIHIDIIIFYCISLCSYCILYKGFVLSLKDLVCKSCPYFLQEKLSGIIFVPLSVWIVFAFFFFLLQSITFCNNKKIVTKQLKVATKHGLV